MKSTQIYVDVLFTDGNQSKNEENLSRCIEQEVCNVFYMHLNQKIKFNDNYMKIEPPMWIAADFE